MRTLRSRVVACSLFLAVPALASPPVAVAVSPDAEAARADINKTFGFVPTFFQNWPQTALPGAWEEMKGLQMNPNTVLSGKIKELIGLAVSAQIPCKYCIYAHTKFAKANGATDQEIGEAVAMGGLSRHWSTFMNGMALDEAKFKTEIQKVTSNMKAAMQSGAKPTAPVALTDAASARKEIEASFGFTPDFIKQFPDEGLVGAWKGMRDVEMSPNTALSGKHKSLIGLAVSAQVPCKYCVLADTEFAKVEGATDRELREAVALASFVRSMSTVLNGMQTDETTFRKDIDRVLKNTSKAPGSKSASR